MFCFVLIQLLEGFFYCCFAVVLTFEVRASFLRGKGRVGEKVIYRWSSVSNLTCETTSLRVLLFRHWIFYSVIVVFKSNL